MTHPPTPNRRPRPAAFVLAGGLVAGTLDIVYACAFWASKAGVPARRILQSVASGLLGRTSFEGGAATAALGLALHFLIATSMSAAYYLVAHRWPLLRRRPVLGGGAYGLILYGVMNHVVVPLSAAGPGSKDPLWIALSIAVHVLLIGIPIALFARRAHRGLTPARARPRSQPATRSFACRLSASSAAESGRLAGSGAHIPGLC